MSAVKKSIKQVVGIKEEKTYEELCAIHKRRRAVLKRSEDPFYRVISYWDATSIQLLWKDPLLLVTMGFYVGFRLKARFGVPDHVEELAAGDISIVGGFLSFFLVYFVVQNNTRFFNLYGNSMSCEGRIFDVATMARNSLPRPNALRLIRYMNAAHVAGYVGLADDYSLDNFFIPLNETNQFLTESEIERMKQIDMDAGGSCYRELISWCIGEVEEALARGLIDPRHACQFRDAILRLRGALGALYDMDDQPMSFFYLHFISFISAVYLPLFAIHSAYGAGIGDNVFWAADVEVGLIVLLQAMFVVGLRILGQQLSNPYGSDVEDLSVMHYVNFTWRMSNRILLSEKPAPMSETEEEDLFQSQQTVGNAWTPYKSIPIPPSGPAHQSEIVA